MGELNRDRIDRQMHIDSVPNWPEMCRECLRQNGCDPGQALWCPPGIDGPACKGIDARIS